MAAPAPDFLFDGPARGKRIVMLAHGAGAPMDTPFMTAIAEGLAAEGLRVARFEFPYMAERRQSGRRKPPDRELVLIDTLRVAIAALGKPDKLRTAHLEKLRTPALIVQGTRDPFGTKDDVAAYKLAKTIRLHWSEDSDHDLKPRKASGRTHAEALAEAVAAAAQFISKLKG